MSSETRLRDAIQDSLKQLREQHAAALDAVVKTFIEAAVAECDAEVAETRAQTETAARLTLETSLSKAKEEAEAQLADVRAEVVADAQRRLETSLSQAKAQADASVADALRTAREEAVNARAEVDKMREEVASARAGAEKTLEEAANARAEAEKAREDAANARAEVDKAREDAANARAAVDKAREDAANARAAGDQAPASAVPDSHRAEREADLAAVSRLRDAIRTLDEAPSLTEVFDALADRAAREADRAAVLLVRGDQLRGWRFVGFGDGAPDAQSFELSLDGTGVIVEAVRSRASQTASPDNSAFAFAPLPAGRAGLAVPVEVGGHVVAVVYADGAAPKAGTKPSGWPDVLEILARHAGRCLEAVTLTHTRREQPAVSNGSESEPSMQSVS